MSEYVLGVDVATKSGCAVYGDGTVQSHWTCGIGDIADAINVCDELSVHVVALEMPFLGLNPNTLTTLARIHGRWEQEAERRGLRVIGVTAKEWQSAILALGPRAKRKELKKASVANALRLWNKKMSEDEADAAGLAMYVSRKLRLEQKAGGK